MRVISRSFNSLLIGLLLLLVAVAAMAIVTDRKIAAAPTICKVVIALDRSASIGDNWKDLRGQVLNLFDPIEGLNRDDIEIAFWTFSHVSDTTGINAGENYNSPYYDYVKSNDPLGRNSFENKLPEDGEAILSGQTNYAQGFGFDNGTPNNKADAGQRSISAIRGEANVVAFLTDSAPNYPGGSDNNADAVNAGYAARQNYGSGVKIIGGYINKDADSTFVPTSLYRTINGPPVTDPLQPVDTTAENVGPLGFNSLTEYLRPRIIDACPDSTPSNYSLEPTVNIVNNTNGTGDAVNPGDTIGFDYQVNNTTTDGSNGSSSWKLYDVTIRPNVSGNPFYFDTSSSRCTTTVNRPYCDGVINCTALLNMIPGQQGSCDDAVPPGGGRGTCGTTPSTSPVASTSPYNFVPGGNNFYGAPRCQTIAELPVGTRICSILALSNATSTGIRNRVSRAACVTIAKTPLVQIHGGDVRVGHKFDGDTTPSPSPGTKLAGIFTSQFRISQDATVVPNGRTYGSWVEYAALAPGNISRFASQSGLAGEYGGYEGRVDSSMCDQAVNALTFANKVSNTTYQNECGHLSGASGQLPDVLSSLTTGSAIPSASFSKPLQINAGTIAGLYKDDTVSPEPNFEIAGGTLPKGKTVIIYVPNGTITINGNIEYDDAGDKYQRIEDIPQVVLIAKNINIREGVGRVDAWLVAPGKGSDGGFVDTCYGFARPLRSAVCAQPLTINGPVIARQMNLWRTRVDTAGCKITTPTDCVDVGDPAEIINLPGSAILWAQAYGQNSSKAQTVGTIELPPYF